jgi:kumamolisin
MRHNLVPLEGSKPVAHPGVKAHKPAHSDETVEVLLWLQSRSAGVNVERSFEEPRAHLSHEEFERLHGAKPDDIERIYEFAHDHGFSVVEADAGRRIVKLAGSAASCARAFGVRLVHYTHNGLSYRSHAGQVRVPDRFREIVHGVFGLNERPQVRPFVRPFKAASRLRHKHVRPFLTPELADHYHFPSGYDGRGECIAVIEFGGGYRSEDMRGYFRQLGMAVPAISSVSVSGAHNHRGRRVSVADQEVVLDLEVVGSVAPGAKIVVYFAPPGEKGFIDSLTRAIHESVHNPSVISISWGMEESEWNPLALRVVNDILQQAAMLGITVCCATGDRGSSDGHPRTVHVNFPASSPFALACGGTHLRMTEDGSIEKVWNDGTYATGGGVSDFFTRPKWQKNANVPLSKAKGHKRGRGLPDAAANADPDTGYSLVLGGRKRVLGGTSAVAPLFAGMIARINQKLGRRVGYLNPVLYRHAVKTELFRNIGEGNNGAYHAGPGWDPCTGWGSPRGEQLTASLERAEHARAA